MKILSLIIPIYNVQDYLSECIRTVLSQNINNNDYEIILINDGSTDKSGEIAQDYANRFPNIKLINQSNKGLSVTRNIGISNSNGKYIWFIDSDDWIEEKCLALILEKCINHNVDVLAFDYYSVFSNVKQRYSTNSRYIDTIVSGKDYFVEYKFHKQAQLYIFRKKLLTEQNVLFTPNILHEDREFTPNVIFTAKTVLYVNKALYYYRQREGSIVSVVNPKRCKDLIDISKRQEANIDRFKTRNTKKVMYKIILQNMTYACVLASRLEEKEQDIVVYKLKNNRKLILKSIFFQNIKNGIDGFLLLLSPTFYSRYHSFKQIIKNTLCL